jgi:hypothetical protein
MRSGTKMTGGSPLLRPGMITAIASPARFDSMTWLNAARTSRPM